MNIKPQSMVNLMSYYFYKLTELNEIYEAREVQNDRGN